MEIAGPSAVVNVTVPGVETSPRRCTLNVTVPLGIPAPGTVAVTVADSVTLCPKTDGFTDDARAVALSAWLTTCESVPVVLVMKFVSPL